MDAQQTHNKSAQAVVNTVPKRRAWVVVLSSVLLTLILVGSAFGAYIAYTNTLREREIKELNNTIESLKREKTVTVSPTPTNVQVTPTRNPNIPSDWVKFEDKEFFGISFYHPKNWDVRTEAGRENETIGDRLVIGIPNSSIDLLAAIEFNQIENVATPDCRPRSTCEIRNVNLLGKTVNIDTTGNSNSLKLKENPRLPESGVNGYLQFTIDLTGLEGFPQAELQNIKLLLESIVYN